jgi:hypothetical protein
MLLMILSPHGLGSQLALKVFSFFSTATGERGGRGDVSTGRCVEDGLDT